MRALPAVLAALLVTAALVAASGAPAGAATGQPAVSPDGGSVSNNALATATEPRPQVDENVSPENETVNVLTLPQREANRSALGRYYVDLGASLDFSTNATNHRLATLAALEHIESAETAETRQQRILGELNHIEQRVITLRSRQSRTLSAFTNGDIGPRTTLVRLARIDREARALEHRREEISALVQETPEFAVDSSRMNSLKHELDALTGPVRAHAASVLLGQSEAGRIYVATGEQSLVLSAVIDDTFVREAYRGDLRNRTNGRVSPQEAAEITNRSYPAVWTMRNDTEITGSGGSYLVRVTYNSGTLSTFIDSGSQTVFKEFHRRPLETVELGEPVADTKDGLRLRVNRTYPGGPLKVRLTESATDTPVDANITIGLDGEESTLVGATGSDGELWTLSPGGRFTVTAIRGNSVVLVTFEPVEAPRIADT